jgi:hypothetical protein
MIGLIFFSFFVSCRIIILIRYNWFENYIVICGDSEVQDKLVGRCMIYNSCSGTLYRHISWYCDVTSVGQLTKSSDVARLLAHFLANLSNVVNLQHSVKMNLLKFHLMTHIPGDILKWGIPSAYNSTTGESNHKMLIWRSKKTQRKLNLIEEKTGVWHVENLAIPWSIQDWINTGFVHWSVETRKLDDTRSQTKFSDHVYYISSQGIYDITNSRRFT